MYVFGLYSLEIVVLYSRLGDSNYVWRSDSYCHNEYKHYQWFIVSQAVTIDENRTCFEHTWKSITVAKFAKNKSDVLELNTTCVTVNS